MSFGTRSVAAALLALAGVILVSSPAPAQVIYSNGGGLCDQLTAAAWEPALGEKLQKEFTVEQTRYDSSVRRFTWILRTTKPYPGPLGEQEKKLQEELEKSWGKTAAFFYDGEGRKLGEVQVTFTAGERAADGRFAVFADLNLQTMIDLAARAVITESKLLEDPFLGKKKNDKGPDL